MTNETSAVAQPNPKDDLPGRAPTAPSTPEYVESGANLPEAEKADTESDLANRARGGSTYGFGTPAEGFGRQHGTPTPEDRGL